MDLRNLIFNVDFQGNASPVRDMDSATDQLRDTVRSATDDLKSMEKTMGKVGKGLMKKVTAPIVGLGTASIATVASFDDSMSQVQAISGATSDELLRMRNLAKDLGATTAHSASAAADGMTILATAGWNTNQVLAGTPTLLSLASASGLELAQAADIMTNTMGQFSISAENSNMVADIFAKAASSSQTNVEQLGEAMKMAGGSAATMNMDLAQTNAMLGTFANQGLKGSIAGTAFTGMFNDLSNKAKNGAVAIGKSQVAVYDATGAMRDMGSIMADIEKATDGMSDAQRNQALQSVFGIQAMRGVNAYLTEGTEKYKQLESAIYGSEGAAAQMADDMENNIAGAFRSMKSAIEGFMIDLGDVFKDDVRKVAEGIGNLASMFGKLDDSQKQMIVKVLGLAAALGPLIFGVSKVIGLVTKIGPAMTAAKAVFAVITGPIGLTVAAVVGLVGALIYLYNTNEEVRDLVIGVWNSLKELFTVVVGFIMGLWDTFGENIKNVAMSAWSIVESFIGSALGVIQGAIKLFVGIFTGDWSGAWEGAKQIVSSAFDFFKELPSHMLEIGKNIIQGLIKGVKSMAGAAKDAVVGVAKGIGEGIKGFFGIKSPAKLTIGYGENVTQGLKVGMENEIPDLRKTTQAINQQVDYSLEPQGYIDRPVSPQNTNTQHISFSPQVEIVVGPGTTEKDMSDMESKVRAMMEKEFNRFFAKLNMQLS